MPPTTPAWNMPSLAGTCGGTDALAEQVARHSSCPGSLWHDRIASILDEGGGDEGVTILNVGANKGYNLVEYAQRYAYRTNVTLAKWRHLMQHVVTPRCARQCDGQCWLRSSMNPDGAIRSRARARDTALPQSLATLTMTPVPLC